MTKKIYSCGFMGLDCYLVEVEADISGGLPLFSIVGLGDASVQESKERVRSSIKNSGFTFPQNRKTINLAPAEIKKQGSLYDFPIAVSLLVASSQLCEKYISDSVFIGELSLAGNLKPIHGALAITEFVKLKNYKRIFLPKENFNECSLISGIEIVALEKLKDLIDYSKIGKIIFSPPDLTNQFETAIPEDPNPFSEIAGHDLAKRALTIVASGSHSLLFDGPPGCGKTLLARSLTKILPPLTTGEKLLATKIFSIAGKLDPETPIVTSRPFREVNPTASLVSIIGGGGKNPKPGEITLAHNGVIYFDEIPEFPRQTIESLRQPFEDRFVIINRANFSLRFPSNFILIASKNPCPCGYFNSKTKRCICTNSQIQTYKKRLSGPILDRFDMYLELEDQPIHEKFKSKMKKAFSGGHSSHSTTYAGEISNALKMQKSRFSSEEKITRNSEMTFKDIQKYCPMSNQALDLLQSASKSFHFSTRAYLKVIRLSRTIADLSLAEEISESHISEALQYRYK